MSHKKHGNFARAGGNIKWTWVAGIWGSVSFHKNSGAKCHLMKSEHVSADIEDSLEGFR